MILMELFWTFLKIGFVSFGGGYAMIPVIEREVTAHGWLTMEQFMNSIALAGMSPGPIATNSAVFVGYQTAGLPGAAAALAGIVLPSLVLVIGAAAFFYKVHHNKWVKSAFYGLRPIVTGLILYGAIRFGLGSWSGGFGAIEFGKLLLPALIFAGALYALVKVKMHPFYVIVLAGAAGIAIFS
ncbi:chromate transporter [Paenibacillus turpanensis]|uniref:chromate transporter n=1 Tax=Paenibacillus turpanensis TaxID=2689078 RepID=UPI001407DA30|nr:chromate transporter [Paenibacillus turpanensis]